MTFTLDSKPTLLNPVVALIVNTSTKRYHPIFYKEAPLPGPPSESKPIRHKSGGHHTDGFVTREEAIARARGLAKEIIEHGYAPACALCLDPKYDIAWDGQDVPADVAFFEINGEEAKRLM